MTPEHRGLLVLAPLLLTTFAQLCHATPATTTYTMNPHTLEHAGSDGSLRWTRWTPYFHTEGNRRRLLYEQPGTPMPALRKALLAKGGVPEDFGRVSLLCKGGGRSGHRLAPARSGLGHTVKISALFILSYAVSIGFNVNSKKAVNLVSMPWTYAALNLCMGAGISLVTWGVDAAPWPKISKKDILTLVPIAFLHMVSHLTVVLGLGAGSVSFVHTVKAAEACFTAVFSVMLRGQLLPLPAYLSLLPVVIGVGITSCNQARFSSVALATALTSNFSNALRNVLVVKSIGPAAAKSNGVDKASARYKTNLSIRAGTATSTMNNNEHTRGINTEKTGLATVERGDTFRLLTTIGAAILLPIAVARESPLWLTLWRGAMSAADESNGGNWAGVARHSLLAALCWNAYYDVSFRLLDQLHPITHAVGNTFKRVFVIGAGALAFGGDLGGAKSMLGSALAVLGVLGYSVATANHRSGGGTSSKRVSDANGQ